MKKFLLILFAGLLLSCASTLKVKNDIDYVGKTVSDKYLKEINITYVQTTKTEINLDGKVKHIKNGKKCYVITKGNKSYLLIDKLGEFEIKK